MSTKGFQHSYTYSDIGLVPRSLSTINSRNNTDTKVAINNHAYWLPIIAAPMEKITGIRMSEVLVDSRILGIQYRTSNLENDLLRFSKTNKEYRHKVGISLGATGNYLERYQEFTNLGAEIFCIDTANGFQTSVGKCLIGLNEIKWPGHYFIAGNVASWEGFKYLSDLKADGIRVGIGNGSACRTSIATGVGIGQASLVRDIFHKKNIYGFTADIIADGGCKEPGDICKAIALGADLVMIGGMLAGTDEAEGGTKFAGQASASIKGNNSYIEGSSFEVSAKGPVKNVLQSIDDGLRSCMSYMNCHTIRDLNGLDDEEFAILSPAAMMERLDHGKLWNR